jgi:response regulator RpfG family c-di-GMP phosphodiesterase
VTMLGASLLEREHEMGLTTVLAVDDEPSILSALNRLLRPEGVRVLTAVGGEEALAVLEEHGPAIGAVFSDYAMPGMNGAELLRAVRLRWPDITRVLLTGNADLPAAAQAVNEGHLSRLYTKPWQPDQLRQAVAQALEQHRVLVEYRRLRSLADEQAARLEQWNQRLEHMVAERTAELERANAGLHRGLLDSVRLLLTLLERRLPQRARRCREVARLAGRLAERAGLSAEEARWVQVAALVHDIGLVGLSDEVLRRTPSLLPPTERAQYERHPIMGQSMLSTVEPLADMGTWIRHHHERWDGNGYPDRLVGAAIPLASRVIALVDGYLEAAAREGGTAIMWRRDQRHTGAFDPGLLTLLDDEVLGRPINPTGPAEPPGATEPSEPEALSVPVAELRAGMRLEEPIRTAAGAALLQTREKLTGNQVERVRQMLAAGALATEVVTVATSASMDEET